MKKILLFFYIITNICFANESENNVVFLKENFETVLNEDATQYIASSESIKVRIEPKKVHLTNVSLSPVTSVYLNLFLTDGSVKTYIIKKFITKNSISHNKKRKDKNLNLRISAYGISDKQKTLGSTIRLNHTVQNITGEAVVNLEQKNKIKKTFLDEASMSTKSHKIKYKKMSSIGNHSSSYNVSNYYQYLYDIDFFSFSSELGKLKNNYNIQQVGTTFQSNSINQDLSIINNVDGQINEYSSRTSYIYKKNKIDFRYNFNHNKKIPNYYHEYDLVYNYTFFQKGEFHLKNFTYNYYNNQFSHEKVDQTVRPKRETQNLELKSQYKDIEISNGYSQTLGIFNQNFFLNRALYNNDDYNFVYRFDSVYAITDNKAQHTMGHYMTKNYDQFSIGANYVFNNEIKTYEFIFNKTFDMFDIQTRYSMYESLFNKSDSFGLKTTIDFDLLKIENTINYSNFFTDGNSLLYNYLNFSYNINRDLGISIYNQYSKYQNINKENITFGFNLFFDLGTNIEYSSFSRKKKDTVLYICVDYDLNDKCEDSEYYKNQEIIFSEQSHQQFKTDNNGRFIFPYEIKDDISVSIDNLEYQFHKMDTVKKDELIIIFQKLKKYKVMIFDQEKEILSDIKANLVCFDEVKKQVSLYHESIYFFPEDCSLVVDVLSNSLPLDKDYEYKITKDNSEIVLNLSPLRRKTIIFYKDKNKNREYDHDEGISLRINKKIVNETLIIDNYTNNQPIVIDQRYHCNLQINTHKSKFFNDIIFANCDKR